ncbi:M1 family metallopeptidase [Flaviaesturariibacter terrae]
MKYTIAALLLLIAAAAGAQGPLFMPQNIRKAYTEGSRSPDGAPGKAYWQNKGRYTIEVKLAPPQKTITGHETIVYTNNSPRTLDRLVIKLIQNVHKPAASRLGAVDTAYLTAGTTIDRYTENGVEKTVRKTTARTFMDVPLSKKLAPGDSVTVTFDWHYNVSNVSGREGRLDSTSFFLAYFYPRIAVYDDTHGWDRMDFVEAQEFYNEFNDYEVAVTVPANFLVWGTGMLQNAEAVLTPAYLEKYNRSLTSDEVINVVTQADIRAGGITPQAATLTWRFGATHVPDAAFCISDHYVWDAASIVVDKATGRRASCQAAFIDTAANFHNQVRYIRHSLDFFSNVWPGVAYPFPKSTIIQGVADMEYPMMANDSPQDDSVFQRFVAEHEVGHSYFPFYMGINEHRYGFMDEGWTTAFEYIINIRDLGRDRADGFFKQFRVNGWALAPTDETQVPIITPGNLLNSPALGINEYGKPALAYLALKDLLGDEVFRKSLQGFMQRWNGKHPLPWDMFNSFSNLSGHDLTSFWNNWFFTTSYMDVAIDKLTQSKTGSTLTVKNIGGFYIPFDVQLTYADGSKDTVHYTAAVWEKNGKLATLKLPGVKKIASLKIDGGLYVDADASNNSWGEATQAKTAPAALLDKAVGTYSSAQVPIRIRITRAGNSLQAEADGKETLQLAYDSGTTFVAAAQGIAIEFDMTKGELTLKQGGANYVFKKEKAGF